MTKPNDISFKQVGSAFKQLFAANDYLQALLLLWSYYLNNSERERKNINYISKNKNAYYAEHCLWRELFDINKEGSSDVQKQEQNDQQTKSSSDENEIRRQSNSSAQSQEQNDQKLIWSLDEYDVEVDEEIDGQPRILRKKEASEKEGSENKDSETDDTNKRILLSGDDAKHFKSNYDKVTELGDDSEDEHQAICKKLYAIDMALLKCPLALIAVFDKYAYLHGRVKTEDPNELLRSITIENTERHYYVVRKFPRFTRFEVNVRVQHWFVRSHYFVEKQFRIGHTQYEIQLVYRTVNMKASQTVTKQTVDKKTKNRTIKTCAVSFNDEVAPNIVMEGDEWYSDGLTDKETREKSIRHKMARASEDVIDFLAFPELTIEEDQVDSVIADWISDNSEKHSPSIILAGSYHTQNEDGEIVNRAHIVDEAGDLILTVCKYNPAQFGSSSESIVLETNGAGHIIIKLLLTNVGVFAFPVCLDLVDKSDVKIFDALRFDWCLFCAMDDSHKLSLGRAKDMYGRNRTNTIAAIQPKPNIKQSRIIVSHIEQDITEDGCQTQAVQILDNDEKKCGFSYERIFVIFINRLNKTKEHWVTYFALNSTTKRYDLKKSKKVEFCDELDKLNFKDGSVTCAVICHLSSVFELDGLSFIHANPSGADMQNSQQQEAVTKLHNGCVIAEHEPCRTDLRGVCNGNQPIV